MAIQQTGTEMRDSDIRLLAPAKIGLRDQDVSHGEHSETSELLWCVLGGVSMRADTP